MKKILFILLLSFLVFSCGNKEEKTIDGIIESGNLSEIRTKKDELNTLQNELKAKIERLNTALDKLDKNRNRTLVTVQQLKDTIFKHYIEVQGDVETDENILIFPEYTGILSDIYVKEGQRVHQGQVLAKIEDGGLASQLAQSEAQLSLAKTAFERQERLWNQQIGSEMQFLEAKSNYEATENAVKQLRTQLAKTVVKASFSGVIDKVIADRGQVVTQGQNQLFRLVNLRDMYITAEVPESYLSSIDKGTEVLVAINAIGKEFKGNIEQVSNFINPDNRSFEVRVSIPNKDGLVKPNLIATVKLNDYTSEKATIVPQNVLQENAHGEHVAYIAKLENDSLGTAQKAVVKIGKSYLGNVEVTEGLKEGETLIIEGSRTIQDGKEIKVKH